MVKKYVVKSFVFISIFIYMITMIIVNIALSFVDLWDYSSKRLHRHT
ncbi:MAG: hypothetical protein ACM34K_19505 [Bacillota bacterium]